MNALVCVTSGGIAAARKPTATPRVSPMITVTASGRDRPLRTSQLTAGSRPIAMNIARPMRTSASRADAITVRIAYVVANVVVSVGP